MTISVDSPDTPVKLCNTTQKLKSLLLLHFKPSRHQVCDPWLIFYLTNPIIVIIESVDSESRDGPDTPMRVIQNKKPKYSIQIHF